MLSGANPILTVSQKLYYAKVAKYLKLLTDFVVHMLIERVNFFQCTRMGGVDITKRKLMRENRIEVRIGGNPLKRFNLQCLP
jgi:hypothetical protein